jgi:hypothetical protein
MNKYLQPILFTVYGCALAYFGYKAVKDALQNPPEVDEDGRKLIVDYDDDGSPIAIGANEIDIDSTLEAWAEQNRMIRRA